MRPGMTIQQHNETAAARWSAGGAGYDRISRQIADLIEHCVDRLDPRPGERILDLATGTGWTARRLHARGARVIGGDIAADLLEAARILSPAGIEFQQVDAERMPFDDGAFDALSSTCGVMFANVPEAAAAEVGRVVKRGGRIALAVWTHDGALAEMFEVIKAHAPAPAKPGSAPPSPFEWGRPERVRELLGKDFDLKLERGTSLYRERDAKQAWKAFYGGYGPVKVLADALDPARREAFQRDFIAFHERHLTDWGMLVRRDYWIVGGTRL
jgi:SAM-dependent methyltransferase